jgi:hypothetical protein
MLSLVFAIVAGQKHKVAKPPPVSTSEAASVRRFTQRFYDWYTPKSFKESPRDAEHIALKEKAALFAPQLRRALLDDEKAQDDWDRQGKDGIVGIDWDPFMYSQDPDPRYYVNNVEHKGKVWLVSLSSEKHSVEPNVIAKVEKHGAQWQFVDFLMPQGGTLMESLRMLKRDRGH